MINYEIVLKKFKEYLDHFDLNEKELAMKASHSYHVADLAKKLAKRMELTEEDTILAMTIGLLHDIGRFVQYEKTHCYSDIKSNIDHALVADNYLFSEGHIKDFAIDKKYHTVIRKAIQNHNKLAIESDLTEKELFFAKLIRDVDKIDIFRQDATSYEPNYNEPLTLEVKDMFYKHILIDRLNIKNKSDVIISVMAFVYDMNFKESYELLYDTDNLELYLSTINVQKGLENEFESVKKEIRNYLEERISE